MPDWICRRLQPLLACCAHGLRFGWCCCPFGSSAAACGSLICSYLFHISVWPNATAHVSFKSLMRCCAPLAGAAAILSRPELHVSCFTVTHLGHLLNGGCVELVSFFRACTTRMHYPENSVLYDAPAALQACAADLFGHLQLHVCFAHMKNSRLILLETDYTGASCEVGSRCQYPA